MWKCEKKWKCYVWEHINYKDEKFTKVDLTMWITKYIIYDLQVNFIYLEKIKWTQLKIPLSVIYSAG